MKTTKRIISLLLSTIMVMSAFVLTTAFAAITDSNLWFSEDFQDDTVNTAYNAWDNDKFRNAYSATMTVMQDSDSENKYLRLTNELRFGQPNNTVFNTYLTGRGGTNTWIFEFDFRLPTLGTETVFPSMQFRHNSSSAWVLKFIGNKLYKDDVEVSGITIEAMKWMHLTYMNSGSGVRVYLDGVLIASTNGPDTVANSMWLFGKDHNYDADNFRIYAFTNGDVTTAVANAGICRSASAALSAARLDAAVAELVDLENTAVSTSATETADYTTAIAKVNDAITLYNTAVSKNIPAYAEFKDDATFGAEVLNLLAYFDADSTGTASELSAAADAFEAIFKRTVNITEFTVCDNAANIKGSVIPAKATALNIAVAPDSAGVVNADITSGTDGKFSYDFTLDTPETTGNYTVTVTATEDDGIPFDSSSQNTDTFELKNAADRTAALAFSAYSNADLSAFETELKTTNNFFYCLDMANGSDYDKLVNKNYVLEKLLENKPYSTVLDLKNEFTYHITMQRLRETTDPAEIAGMLENYYNILTGDTLSEQFRTYKMQICELLAANIAVVTDADKLEEFIKTAQMYYQINDATRTTIADTFNAFADNDETYNILVKHGLDEDYKTADSSVQTEAAKAILDAELSLTNSFTLAQEMAKLTGAVNTVVNTPVEEEEDLTPSYRPSGGGGGGGGGGIGNVTISKPLEKENEEIVVNPQPILPAEPENKDYTDVSQTHWAVDAIYAARDKGIMTGDGNGNFYPDEYVKREEMAKIIVEAFDIVSNNKNANFEDVADNMWYSDYIDIAVSAGLITGESETEFGFGKAMTRQDVAVIIYRYLSQTEYSFEAVEVEAFTDESEIADYAKEAVKFMQQHNLMVGSDGKFSPRQPLTRAMAAKIICNLTAE